MNPSDDYKLTDLDYLIGDHHLQMIKAALPYLGVQEQKAISLFVKAQELRKTVELFETEEVASMGICSLESSEGTGSLRDLLKAIRPYGNPMERDMIDILCFTGHKGLMGPQGTGGMCVRKGVGIRPLLSGGSGIMTYSRTHPDSMPTALEAGTLNAHGLAGLRASLTYIREQGVDEIREKEIALMRRFYDQVKTIPGVRIYGDFKQEQRAAVVALNLGDEDSGEVSDYLAREHEIYTRSGGHCAPLMHETLGTREQGAVRFSFSHFNREEEVDMACLALRAY